ncbi:MAG TPA: hypothetical protein VF147_18570 [Vicinamibacterales bacterium]
MIFQIHSRIATAPVVRQKGAGVYAMTLDPDELEDRYAEYARKMDLFMDGPTTTYYEQLVGAGIELPRPDSIADGEMRTKLWEVIAGLERLRAFLEHTNHLSDRELYARLWQQVLREETPAIDEIGFNSHLDLACPGGSDEETLLYLKHYADDRDRESWLTEFPGDRMPAHEDPPFTRDDLLPGPSDTVAEAAAWLRANWGEHAFATNRFETTAHAIQFVDQLYAAGATLVCVDNVMMLPNHGFTPYADTLLVRLPEDPAKRSALFKLIEHIGKPDEDGGKDYPVTDWGQTELRLWWD